MSRRARADGAHRAPGRAGHPVQDGVRRGREPVAVGSVFPLPLRATYEFPDGEPCPDDINKHRQGGQHGTE